MFFDQRESGPSNKNVAASDSVQENVALAALAAQSEYAQAQKVGGKYWDPAKTFGELIAQGTYLRMMIMQSRKHLIIW